MTQLSQDRGFLASMLLPLRRYAQFTGRSGWREFWAYSLFLALGYLVLFSAIIGAVLAWEETSDEWLVGAVAGTFGIFFLANFVPGLALSVRRLHDIGWSGAVLIALFSAYVLIPGFGWLAYLIVMSLPPQAGPNRHGSPLGTNAVADVFA